MHPLIVSGAISFLANLLIGAFVYSRGPTNRTNILFSLFSVLVSGWSVGSFLENVIPDRGMALAVLRSNYLCGIWLLPVYVHFVYSFTAMTRTKKRVLVSAYAASALLSLTTYTPLFIRDLRVLQVEPYRYLISSPGVLYYVFFVFFGVSVTEVLRTALHEMRNSQGQRRVQFKYLVIANAIAIGAGFEYFSRVFGLLKSPPLDDYILVGYLLVLAYAIVRHQLLDITVVIRKSLVYSTLAAVITAVYFSLVLVTERVLQGFVGYRSLIGSLIAGFVITLGVNPLKEIIQRCIDRLFFKGSQVALAAENERLRRELTHSDKLKAVATLAAGMAHEIKNPLTAIKTFAEYLPEKYDDAAFREKCTRIVTKEVSKIDQIVRQLLDFARPAPPKLQPIQLSGLLDETLELLSSECLRHRVSVERAYAPADTIQADPQQLRQAFLNLFLNSLEAMDGQGGTLAVATTQQEAHLTVTITDTGPGIPKEHLDRLGEPFFTTKASGTGLGLAVVQGILKEHHGHLRITSEVGQGTTVRITLPY